MLLIFLLEAHGVRTVENLKRFCGITDPEELEVSQPTSNDL